MNITVTAGTNSEKMIQKSRTDILMHGILMLFFAVVIIWCTSPAFAGSASTNLPVTAEIIGDCTVSTNTMNFDYIAGGNEVTVLSELSINCSNQLSYIVELDNGLNEADGVRQMTDTLNPGNLDTLIYDLYHSDCTSRWHIDSEGQSGTGNGQDQTYTVCGKISSGQDISASTYKDTITVNIVIQ